VETGLDGNPCTPENPSSDLWGTVCTHLEIQEGEQGGYVGTIYRERSPWNAPLVFGPFAPATNPTRGYPMELLPEEYGHARAFTPDVRYRLFDGLVRDGELTFWVTPLDLWTDWCGMQSSFQWEVSGKHEYRCVPQTASESDTDLGKLALCTSAEDLGYCEDAYSFSHPCVCLDDTLHFDFTLPLCSLPYCECSATECHADYRGTAITGTFRLEGDALAGNIAFDIDSHAETLRRVTP
jgi:hypothetical protein